MSGNHSYRMYRNVQPYSFTHVCLCECKSKSIDKCRSGNVRQINKFNINIIEITHVHGRPLTLISFGYNFDLIKYCNVLLDKSDVLSQRKKRESIKNPFVVQAFFDNLFCDTILISYKIDPSSCHTHTHTRIYEPFSHPIINVQTRDVLMPK